MKIFTPPSTLKCFYLIKLYYSLESGLLIYFLFLVFLLIGVKMFIKCSVIKSCTKENLKRSNRVKCSTFTVPKRRTENLHLW